MLPYAHTVLAARGRREREAPWPPSARCVAEPGAANAIRSPVACLAGRPRPGRAALETGRRRAAAAAGGAGEHDVTLAVRQESFTPGSRFDAGAARPDRRGPGRRRGPMRRCCPPAAGHDAGRAGRPGARRHAVRPQPHRDVALARPSTPDRPTARPASGAGRRAGRPGRMTATRGGPAPARPAPAAGAAELAWLSRRASAGRAHRGGRDRFTSVTPAPAAAVPPGTKRLRGLTLPGWPTLTPTPSTARCAVTQAGRGTFWTWRERMYEVAARLTPDSYWSSPGPPSPRWPWPG